MSDGFPDLMRNVRISRFLTNMEGDDAANRIPLDELREPARWSDSEHEHRWINDAWEASVEDAARELENLIVIHDNGGTASSPKKIKQQARVLIALLRPRER